MVRKLRTIEMQRLTVEEFHEADKMPLVVVLDDVRSLYNVGSVFRTCDAFRVEALFLCGITATPEHCLTEIHKTALGAEDSVAWRYFETAEEAVEALRRQGYCTIAVEQAEGSLKLPANLLPTPAPKNADTSEFDSHAYRESNRTALILGNEVKGVHQPVIDMCDHCLEIPQFGTKHSMNVSVTAGIVIWEFSRQFLLTREL